VIRQFLLWLACGAPALAGSVLAGTVAVLPLTPVAVSGTPAEWVGESLAEALRQSLILRGQPVLPRAEIAAAYASLRLRWNAQLTTASVLKLGQALNADRIVFGAFGLDAAGLVTARVQVMHRARAELVALGADTAPLADLDRLEATLAWRVLAALAPELAPPPSEIGSLRPPVRWNAEEAFIRGWIATDPAQREKFFEQAAKLDARFARPMLELGKIELARKNYKTATEWLARVAASDPLAPEAGFYLGVARFRQGDYAGAQAAFQRVAPQLGVAEAYNNLGVAESRRDQLHALASFREALQLDPDDPDYHFNMGYILLKTGQFAAAADRFRAVLERIPNDAVATALLGRSLKGEGLSKSPADRRYQDIERFRDTYEEPYRRPPQPRAATAAEP
jgi:tetratricopeptide (TPR) repeat protein